MKELIQIYEKTFSDGRFSRGERSAIRQLLQDHDLDSQQKGSLRARIFDLVRNNLESQRDTAAIEWLEEASKTLLQHKSDTIDNRVFFSPGDDCLNTILSALRNARNTISICVFTISDDRISNEIIDAHRRKINVQVITDNEKVTDKGSDVEMISSAGVPVRIDLSKSHMHHKFAVFDKKLAITGSYNWTRSAEKYNQENIVTSNDKNLVSRFLAEFDRLWDSLRPF